MQIFSINEKTILINNMKLFINKNRRKTKNKEKLLKKKYY